MVIILHHLSNAKKNYKKKNLNWIATGNGDTRRHSYDESNASIT